MADLQRTVYPHKWSPISCRSSVGHGKFACKRPTFYQLCHVPQHEPPVLNHWGLVSARACGSVKTLWLKLCLLHIRSSAERNAYPGVSGNSLKTVLCAIRYVCPINVICLYASVCVNLCHVQKVNTMLYGSQESQQGH